MRPPPLPQYVRQTIAVISMEDGGRQLYLLER